MDTEKAAVSNGEHTAPGALSRRAKKIKSVSLVHRFLVFAACLSAFVVMITNKQHFDVPILNRRLWARYHYSKAFLFFVVANGIGLGYALLTMILSPIVRSPKFVRILLLLDLIMAFFLLSACSAATAIAYVGHKGLPQTQWSPICGEFGRFCDHVAGALVAGFLGWLFLFITIILELHLLNG